MKYECKENDAIIELGKDKEEVLISIKGETAKTVIGLKDLNEALILFGVVKSLKDKKTISFGLWRIKSKDVEAINRTLWTYKGVLKNNDELRQVYDEIKHTL
ncbi:hypothetical protein AVT42_gp36 [Polaribacter phage P12002S]|uniref:Uncharacterized protein n=1 Tax=Polaribacter phage P12002S TaxID=1647387 RepID=A0A0F7IN95_9CAUD|nr:hypothetical protein AVT42_gp36 [Polaribacter phage P12002S]AKG94292.1 hypothetical protein P12002S_0036 [Polaribacter phage P12002S]